MDKFEVKQIYSEQEAVAVMKNLAEFEVLIQNAKDEIAAKQLQIKEAEAMRKQVEEELIKYYKEEIDMDEEFDFDCDYGSFKSRTAAKWNYEDEKKILGYLRQHNPKLIRTKEEVDKTNLKKKYEVVDGKLYDSENDEFIEGLTITRETTYSLTTNPKAVV